jgi:hypothetical protein
MNIKIYLWNIKYAVLVICDIIHVINVEKQSIILSRFKVFKLNKYYVSRNFQKEETEKLERIRNVFATQNVCS